MILRYLLLALFCAANSAYGNLDGNAGSSSFRPLLQAKQASPLKQLKKFETSSQMSKSLLRNATMNVVHVDNFGIFTRQEEECPPGDGKEASRRAYVLVKTTSCSVR
jgi:hypothetical protein